METDAHLQSLFYTSFRALSKGVPLPGSPNRAPIERDAPFPEPPFNYFSEFLVNGPPMILNRAHMEKDARLQSLHKARKMSPLLNSPAGPPWRTMSSWVPRKEPP